MPPWRQWLARCWRSGGLPSGGWPGAPRDLGRRGARRLLGLLGLRAEGCGGPSPRILVETGRRGKRLTAPREYPHARLSAVGRTGPDSAALFYGACPVNEVRIGQQRFHLLPVALYSKAAVVEGRDRCGLHAARRLLSGQQSKDRLTGRLVLQRAQSLDRGDLHIVGHVFEKGEKGRSDSRIVFAGEEVNQHHLLLRVSRIGRPQLVQELDADGDQLGLWQQRGKQAHCPRARAVGGTQEFLHRVDGAAPAR